MDVFINWTQNYFGGQESVSLVMKVERWGKTESLLCLYFAESEAETFLEMGVSSASSSWSFDREAFLQNKDIIPDLSPSLIF